MGALSFPSLRGLPRAYWLLWAGTLVNRLGGFVGPFLAIYLTNDRGLAAGQVGLVVSFLGAGSVAGGFLGGYLADLLGRKRTLVLALSLGAMAMLHLGAARSVPHIALAALLLGLLGELYRPAVAATIADLVPPDDRARAFGLLYWAINLGFAFAGMVGGLVSARGFTTLFVADAVTTLAFAALIYFKIPETRPDHPPGREKKHWTTPFRDGPFVVFIGLTFAVALIFQQHIVAMPLDMGAHGVSPRAYGAVIGLNGVLIILLQPFASRVLAPFSRARVLAFAALVSGLGFGGNALAHTPLGYGLSVTVWTLGEIAMSGIAPAMVADLSPPELRGGYQGVFQMAWGGAACIAPLLGGVVLQRFGAQTLWTGCIVLGALCGLGHLLLGQTQSSRADKVTAPKRG